VKRNVYLNVLSSKLYNLRIHEKDKAKKEELWDMAKLLGKGEDLYEEWIQEAKMIGVRNPAFDGDMVGWLDDDFDYDDKDDDEDKNNKNKQ
jgi:hypothetical protein